MALGWLKDVADIGSAVAGVAGLFGGKDEPEGLDEYRGLLQDQRNLLARQTQLARDIENPPAERVAEEEGTLRRNFAEALRMAMAADRRERARNRGGLFYDRERQDETASRVAAAYYDDVKQKARDNVRAHLTQAAQANNFALSASGNLVSGAGGLVNATSALDDANTSMRASGFDALFSALRGVGDSQPFSDLFSSFGQMLDGSSSSSVASRTNNPLTAGNWGSSSYWSR